MICHSLSNSWTLSRSELNLSVWMHRLSVNRLCCMVVYWEGLMTLSDVKNNLPR